jgi:hypothetical protein
MPLSQCRRRNAAVAMPPSQCRREHVRPAALRQTSNIQRTTLKKTPGFAGRAQRQD